MRSFDYSKLYDKAWDTDSDLSIYQIPASGNFGVLYRI